MRIKVSELRRIIRETLEEQGWVPGRWYPGDGEPVKRDELDLMGAGGLGRSADDDFKENDEDSDDMKAEGKKKKKPGLWANIHAKRKRGERPARPGEKGYPKTLDIGESDGEDNHR